MAKLEEFEFAQINRDRLRRQMLHDELMAKKLHIKEKQKIKDRIKLEEDEYKRIQRRNERRDQGLPDQSSSSSRGEQSEEDQLEKGYESQVSMGALSQRSAISNIHGR